MASMRRVLFSACILLLLLLATSSGVRCPPKCLCFRTTVRCMFLHLEHIPEVPADTTVLDLRFNKIRRITPNAFKNLSNLNTLLLNNNHITKLENEAFNGLENLRYLYLYKNRIRHIEPKVFHGLHSLEQLYLHYNDIRKIDPDSFSELKNIKRLFLHNNRLQRIPGGVFRNLDSLRRLRLDSNALICDCHLMWLAKMVREKQSRTQVAATCEYPLDMQGKSLDSFADFHFQCRGMPEITEGPQDVEVNFGGTAYFSCKAEGDPDVRVIWLHNDEVVSERQRYRLLHDNTLMIENAQLADEGYYECIAKNDKGEVKSRKATISMHKITPEEAAAQPRFIEAPSDATVTEGSPVEIRCSAMAKPEPDISWERDGDPVRTGPRIQVSNEGSLSIASADREDAGEYTCIAANHIGRVAASVALAVFVIPAITKEPEDQYSPEGTSAQFSCEAAGSPFPVIHWTKDEEQLLPDDRTSISVGGRSLRISQVGPSDEGEYVCRAKNEAGQVESSANLYVREELAPVIKKEPRDTSADTGGTVVMPCEVDGLPAPDVRWSKDGQKMLPDQRHKMMENGSLHMYNITMEDSGMYECSAHNQLGYATARAMLTVREQRSVAVGDRFLQESFLEAEKQVNRALNMTVSQLFRRDKEAPPHPHELLRIFRFPSSEAREIARSAEQMEQTLQIVRSHVESGIVFNLTDFNYTDLLSPEKLQQLNRLAGCLAHRRTSQCEDMCFHQKYRSMAGTCNNLKQTMWGSSLTGFRRLLSPIYENGFNTPVGWSKTKRYYGYFKPSARLISTRVISTEAVTPDDRCTHMLMQWGQFLDHDIDHALPSISTESFQNGIQCQTSCSSSAPCFPIEVPPDDPRIRHHRCMEFTRSSAVCGSGLTSVFFQTVQPREQINQLTSFIDASQVYGSSEREMQALRNYSHHRSGELRRGLATHSGKSLLPFSNGAPIDCRRDFRESSVDCFLAGDIRANEQLGLLAMHTLWFREHNRVAQELGALNPHWSGDTVFYEARKIIGAFIQHITYTHWLPHIIGEEGMVELGQYPGYNMYLDPTVSNVFATAAYRFGHSLINPILERLNSTFQPIPEGHLPLHRAFFAPWRLVQEGGIDPLLRGLFSTPAKMKKSGQLLNKELTEKLFKAAHDIALDLAALNIQRGRDHGLPGYIEWRKFCNLTVPKSFGDLRSYIKDVAVRDKLKELYGHPGNIDMWVGGLLEEPINGGRVGPTFRCILIDQFRRLRDGDRFWYENPSNFKPSQLTEIKQVTLGRIICDNSDYIEDIAEDVFILPRLQRPAFISCSKVPTVNLRLWSECCSNCHQRDEFNSIVRTPGVRVQRDVPFSFIEDRDYHNFTASNGVGEQSESAEIVFTSPSSSDSNKSVAQIFDEHDDASEKKNGITLPIDDVMDQRIEGIEAAIERLSKSVHDLQLQVTHLMSVVSLRGNKRAWKKSLCFDPAGNRRRRGESWMKDTCTKCVCKRRGAVCKIKTCPAPSCPNPVELEDRCCPVC